MRHSTFFLITGLGCLVTAAAFAAFTIPWSTMDGGGNRATATSGATTWTLTGTIGQYDVLPAASGGAYTVGGGYWAQAVATPGAPPLRIVPLANGTARVEWDADAVGWTLQSSFTMSPGQWADQGTALTGAGSLIVTPSLAVPRNFYRLRQP